MEEEPKEEIKTPRFRRRVSLFRKRKKPPLRATVRIHKNRNYSSLLTNIAIAILAIFIIAVALYILRRIFIPKIMNNNAVILNPQGALLLDNNHITNVIQNMGLEVERVEFSTTSATVTFLLNKKTSVILSTEKDIRSQLDLVEAIDGQVKQDGKQAIYIDLRYNKPIVKF